MVLWYHHGTSNPDKFIKEITWESFDALTNPKLLDLAKHCEI